MKLNKKINIFLILCLTLITTLFLVDRNAQKINACGRLTTKLEEIYNSSPVNLNTQYATANSLLSCLDQNLRNISDAERLAIWRTLSDIIFNSGNTNLYFENKFLNQSPSLLGGELNDTLIHLERLCWHFRINGQYSECIARLNQNISVNKSEALQTLRGVEKARNELYQGNIRLSRTLLLSLFNKTKNDNWMHPWILFHIAETYMADGHWDEGELFLKNFSNEIEKKRDSSAFINKSYGDLALIYLLRNKSEHKKSLALAQRLEKEFQKYFAEYPSSLILWLQSELFLNSAVLKQNTYAKGILLEIHKNLNSSVFSEQEKITIQLYEEAFETKNINQNLLNRIKLIFGANSPKFIEIKNNCAKLSR